MNTWIICVCIFSILSGLFFMPVVMIRNDDKPFWLRFLKALFITLLIGTLIGSALYFDWAGDESEWNDGKCECGGNWNLFDITDYRNNTTYYYQCEECEKLFESSHHF